MCQDQALLLNVLSTSFNIINNNNFDLLGLVDHVPILQFWLLEIMLKWN